MRAAPLFLLVLAGCGTAQHGPDVTPTDPPTQQDFQPEPGGALRVSWHNPGDSDFAQTLVVLYQARPDGKPFRGTTPTVGESFGTGVVRYLGKGESFLDTALPDLCRAVTYELWSEDTAGNWSVGPAQLPVPRGSGTLAPTSPPTAM